MKIAILQSNYIPWKGYFDLIASVDEFIIYDDMQYTRRDWRNRNKIKTPQGLQWLTVPVQVKGKFDQKIKDTKIADSDWAVLHWKSLDQNYRSAPYFNEISMWLKPLYLARKYNSISDLNESLIRAICQYLGITTHITRSSDYTMLKGKTECLVDLCKQAGGNEYISGPSAKGYIDELIFKDSGIILTWFDYDGYPKYPQLWGDFEHHVTIIDMLFNCGQRSVNFMRYVA
ncbi:WbqC family protein [Polynucleobacter paneuropaeus]|jgi:hypothetical protein|nr:WbqC family protein [Polynucleobacter paneuropaeus]